MVALKIQQPPTGETETLYMLLREPVILLYGKEEIPTAKSYSRASTVFREFRRIGRKKIPVRLVIKGGHMLTPRSLKALNLFLHYGNGLRFANLAMGSTKWGWSELQDQLRLQWRPISALR